MVDNAKGCRNGPPAFVAWRRVRQAYAIVDYIPRSGTKNSASGFWSQPVLKPHNHFLVFQSKRGRVSFPCPDRESSRYNLKARLLLYTMAEAESKEKHGVWDPVSELTKNPTLCPLQHISIDKPRP